MLAFVYHSGDVGSRMRNSSMRGVKRLAGATLRPFVDTLWAVDETADAHAYP